MGLMDKIFGTYSSRELKKVTPIVSRIVELEDAYRKLSDNELKAKTPELKERLANGASLDDILPEAFAACREAGDRVLGMRHYEVQLVGGVVLHQGRISEMKTGEGKTLVATLPMYLNALEGRGVHLVTVNDYLAKRDSEWMGKVFRFMGMSVGLIVHGLENDERRDAYNCDITYATNNELGFDYLRDNMCIYKKDKTQRDFRYAIVDEVDSILIDEARTPLIISGQGDKSTELYSLADRFAKTLKIHKVAELDDKEDNDNVDADYIVDEKAHTATLTPSGVKKAEKTFNVENLMDSDNITLQHHINQSIKAVGLMKRDTDYVVKDGEVIIVDEFTGRLMLGRRYNEGLHQAIEAKENVKVERESKTLATITFQNLFRLYDKLAGMTGTALTEESEFQEIYKLDVIEIPTNKPCVREDMNDVVFKTENGKYSAVIEQIIECNQKGQPVLVGTISIEKSEYLSKLLKKRGVKHSVLNAKYHEKEAEIVAQAGKKGSVTIATNMAGRGTDIVLGGNAEYLAKHDLKKKGYSDEIISDATGFADTDNEEILNARTLYSELNNKYKQEIIKEADEVREAGGVFILGTERHESRRIDNQLRGRSGRQGDPGASRFFLSLEDDLMRLFGGERIQSLMNVLNIEEDQPIQNRMLTGSIESAQRKVEGRNFSIRKNVLSYDDVMNRQRELIYSQRKKVLDGDDLREYIINMIKDMVENTVVTYLPDDRERENWNIEGLRDYFLGFVTTENDLDYNRGELESIEKSKITETIIKLAMDRYEDKEKEIGEERIRELERVILLRNVDSKWMDHIDAMDELKRGINLRAYGQRDPVVEYRLEGFDMFDDMINSIREDTVKGILTARIRSENDAPKRERVAKVMSEGFEGEGERVVKKIPVRKIKIGRNDPCPCGSGKKHKRCCADKEETTS